MKVLKCHKTNFKKIMLQFSFVVLNNKMTLLRFRRVSFPLPIRWKEGLEPRISSHPQLEACKSQQLHPDRGTSAILHRPWSHPLSALSSSPCPTQPPLLSKPHSHEKTLCQVGEHLHLAKTQRTSWGAQNDLWIPGICECKNCLKKN